MKLPREADRHHRQRHEADSLHDREEFFAESPQPMHLVHARDAIRDEREQENQRQRAEIEDEVGPDLGIERDEAEVEAEPV